MLGPAPPAAASDSTESALPCRGVGGSDSRGACGMASAAGAAGASGATGAE